MTREEAITELTVHFEHWKRLKKEHIASVEESDRTIEALDMAIEALKSMDDTDIETKDGEIRYTGENYKI